jgi:hypothetical protein
MSTKKGILSGPFFYLLSGMYVFRLLAYFYDYRNKGYLHLC